MTHAPEILLEYHLKKLKLPTFPRANAPPRAWTMSSS